MGVPATCSRCERITEEDRGALELCSRCIGGMADNYRALQERAERLQALLREARGWIDQRHTPQVNYPAECAACSLIARIDAELS